MNIRLAPPFQRWNFLSKKKVNIKIKKIEIDEQIKKKV